jgi:hypothetical protein
MSKVVYLLGAGASCHCLPLIAGMLPRLQLFAGYIRSNSTKSPVAFEDLKRFNIIDTVGEAEKEFLDHLLDLIRDLEGIDTIDTLAKQLFHTNPSRLPRLKAILSAFFIYEQTINRLDQRYPSFFAKIITGQLDLPKNVSILTWNYDYQLEKAYSIYCSGSDFSDVRNKLGVYPNKANSDRYDGGFAVVKMNGTVGIFNDDTRYNEAPYENFDLNMTDFSFPAAMWHFLATTRKTFYRSLIRFSWEDNEMLEAAKNVIKAADVLIVYGYSFPYFNSNVDKELLKIFFNKPGSKMYVQDLNMDKVMDSLSALLPENVQKAQIILRPLNPDGGPQDNQFYLPKELQDFD